MVEHSSLPDNFRIKRIFVMAENELIRFRPSYLLKYYLETFKSNQIQILGYTIYGDNNMRELKLVIDITLENEDTTINEILINSVEFKSTI